MQQGLLLTRMGDLLFEKLLEAEIFEVKLFLVSFSLLWDLNA